MNKHLGSSFDEFLSDEGILPEVEAVAIKRVIAWQLQEEMNKKRISKSELARRMHTSRPSVDRLLDASNHSVTLLTLEKGAQALNCKLKVSLEHA
jgi:antitoxin HicB